MAVSRYRASSARALLKFALTRLKAGWTRGIDYRETNGRPCYCLRGSVLTGNHYRGPAIANQAIQLIERSLPPGYGSIVGFNDAGGRRKTEVVAVLKAAIAKA